MKLKADAKEGDAALVTDNGGVGVSQSQQRRHNQLKVDRRVTQPCRECASDPLDAMDMMEEASRMVAEEEMAAFQKMKFVVDSGRRQDKVGISS